MTKTFGSYAEFVDFDNKWMDLEVTIADRDLFDLSDDSSWDTVHDLVQIHGFETVNTWIRDGELLNQMKQYKESP